MGGFIDDLSSLGQFLSKLTWKKIFQLLVLIIIVSFAWAAFSTSDQILEFLKSDRVFPHDISIKSLSPKTVAEIETLTSKADIIAGVNVTVVNFQRNARYIIYLDSRDRELKEIFVKSGIQNVELPVFTQNQYSNKRFISMINGEFVCNDYQPNMLAAEIPQSNTKIKHICATGIPPYYGRFIGLVGIFLNRVPTSEEVDQLRVLTKKLSLIVYERELR